MKVKQAALAGMIGLASIAPAKAQSIKFGVEVGLNGQFRKEMNLCGGVNLSHQKKKNFANLFLGLNTNGTKSATSATGIFVDNYSWTRNLSSWFRNITMVNLHDVNAITDISPVRGNISTGKFDFALNPSYTVYAGYKNRSVTQGLGAIFQTTYSITPTDKIFLEMKYSTTPSANLMNTEFGPVKDNMSYIVSYQKTF